MSQGMVQMKVGLVGLGRMGAAIAQLPRYFREFMLQAYE